jgi:hypothetical protein
MLLRRESEAKREGTLFCGGSSAAENGALTEIFATPAALLRS